MCPIVYCSNNDCGGEYDGESTIIKSMKKTFWRSQVNEIYHKNLLLNEISLKRNVLTLSTQDWDSYWINVPEIYQNDINTLKQIWGKYIDNRFDKKYVTEYVESYFSLLSSIVNKIPHLDCIEKIFLAKLVGFENSVFTFSGSDIPFAAFYLKCQESHLFIFPAS